MRSMSSPVRVSLLTLALLPATLVLFTSLMTPTVCDAADFCESSPNQTLSNTTITMNETTLMPTTSMVIPTTDEVLTFMTDRDSYDTAYRIADNSFAQGQTCRYTVMCPSGFYLMFNVTGIFTKTEYGDEAVTILDAADNSVQKYAFSYPFETSYYGNRIRHIGGFSQLTSLNTATVYMSQKSFDKGYGFQVAASCTQTIENGCPYGDADTYLDMSSGNYPRTLDTYVTSEDHPSLPSGIACKWQMKCPAGDLLTIDWAGNFEFNGEMSIKTLAGANITASMTSTATQELGVQEATMEWTRALWNVSSSFTARGFRVTVSCVTGPPVTATPPVFGPSGVGSSTCHYTQTDFALQTGVRNNVLLDFTNLPDQSSYSQALTSQTYEYCVFTFTCPSGANTAMAIQATNNGVASFTGSEDTAVYSGLALTVDAYDPNTGSNLTQVYSGNQLSGTVLSPSSTLTVTALAFSKGYSAVLGMSCMAAQIPAPAEMNFVNSAYTSRTSRSKTLSPATASYKTFTAYAGRRAAYAADTKSGFLISCTGVSTATYEVHITKVAGTTGSEGDFLTITNLDTDASNVYSGVDVETSYSTTTQWSVSRQFYVEWVTDSVVESNADADGLQITYECATASTAASGAGTEVETFNTGSGSGRGFETAGAMIAVLVLSALFVC